MTQLQRAKFIIEWGNPTDEDNQAGRTHCVRYRESYHAGAYLSDVASRCTEADARRIAEALNNYPEACRLLQEAYRVLNDRGRLDPGRGDHNTEDGFLYREVQEFLNTKE